MPLKLFYITNHPEIARIAQDAGVDRIFIDLEYIGKSDRQAGMDTVQSRHSIADIKQLRPILSKSKLLVRCNPVHNCTAKYSSTETEIEDIVQTGADIIMLPYFKTVAEVGRFLDAVGRRCRTLLLFETPEAVSIADEILALDGIDEVFIGLNDLSLGLQRKFMFELLVDGTVEDLCLKFRRHGIPYGFGGMASIGTGALPAEAILKEHYRLGSSMVILSRSFCNIVSTWNREVIKEKFTLGVRIIRAFEAEIREHSEYFQRNQRFVATCVARLVEQI